MLRAVRPGVTAPRPRSRAQSLSISAASRCTSARRSMISWRSPAVDSTRWSGADRNGRNSGTMPGPASGGGPPRGGDGRPERRGPFLAARAGLRSPGLLPPDGAGMHRFPCSLCRDHMVAHHRCRPTRLRPTVAAITGMNHAIFVHPTVRGGWCAQLGVRPNIAGLGGGRTVPTRVVPNHAKLGAGRTDRGSGGCSVREAEGHSRAGPRATAGRTTEQPMAASTRTRARGLP
jgi:hypothetical protein